MRSALLQAGAAGSEQDTDEGQGQAKQGGRQGVLLGRGRPVRGWRAKLGGGRTSHWWTAGMRHSARIVSTACSPALVFLTVGACCTGVWG